MSIENENKEEKKAGYLVIRMASGEGVLLSEDGKPPSEIRVSIPSGTKKTITVAIRAPKALRITRLR